MLRFRTVLPPIFGALLFVGGAPLQAQAAPTEASLRAADDEQRRLIVEGDAAGIQRISHPNLLINGPSGRVVTLAGLLQQVRNGDIAKEKFERVAEATQITGNIGVVVGHENVVAAPGSRDFAARVEKPFLRRYIDVFLFEGGRWLHLARQASIVGDLPAGK